MPHNSTAAKRQGLYISPRINSLQLSCLTIYYFFYFVKGQKMGLSCQNHRKTTHFVLELCEYAAFAAPLIA
jgi:hypothetical protein